MARALCIAIVEELLPPGPMPGDPWPNGGSARHNEHRSLLDVEGNSGLRIPRHARGLLPSRTASFETTAPHPWFSSGFVRPAPSLPHFDNRNDLDSEPVTEGLARFPLLLLAALHGSL